MCTLISHIADNTAKNSPASGTHFFAQLVFSITTLFPHVSHVTNLSQPRHPARTFSHIRRHISPPHPSAQSTARPTVLPLVLTTVKWGCGERRGGFQLITPTETYHLQAPRDAETWCAVLANAKTESLELGAAEQLDKEHEHSHARKHPLEDGKTFFRAFSTLKGNDKCADCGAESINVRLFHFCCFN